MLQIKLKSEIQISRFEAAMQRFGYKTYLHFVDDMITFFENNPVNPKQNFTGLLNNIENKLEEFNKDNNRVIAVVRNIEKNRLDSIYRILSTDVTNDLRAIKKKILLGDVIVNDNIEEKTAKNKEEIVSETIDNNTDVLKESFDKKINIERDRYKILKDEYDKITLEHGKLYNSLKKIKGLYTVEKSTFSSKNKIVLEMSEEEFLNLIKIK
jgi:hypothetical protein